MDLLKEFVTLVRAGDLLPVEDMLAAHPEVIQAATEEGVSVVLLAAYHHHEEVLDLLVERKPKLTIFEAAAIGVPKRLNRKLNEDPSLLNSFSPDGYTALCLACLFNQVETVEMLLMKGAKVNLASRNEAKMKALHGAVMVGQVQMARLLLENGAEVNARQAGGYTPLHLASYNGHAPLVEVFLYHGANPHLQLDNGKTALDIALEKGYAEVAALLEADELGGPYRQYGT